MCMYKESLIDWLLKIILIWKYVIIQVKLETGYQ